MSVVVSHLNVIRSALKKKGYLQRRYRHGALGNERWTSGGDATVIIKSIEFPAGPITPAAVDDYFGNLRPLLQGVNARHRIRDLIFQGGGTVPIPPWFRQWCEEQGIRLHVIDAENVDRVAHDL